LVVLPQRLRGPEKTACIIYREVQDRQDENKNSFFGFKTIHPVLLKKVFPCAGHLVVSAFGW
jgi:hypothetical protein